MSAHLTDSSRLLKQAISKIGSGKGSSNRLLGQPKRGSTTAFSALPDARTRTYTAFFGTGAGIALAR